MATVTKNSANWRILGGGGLLIAGVLWVLEVILLRAGISVGDWLGSLTFLILAVGLAILAFGQTGSNGVVGASALGKILLVLLAAAWLVYAIGNYVALGQVVHVILAIVVIVAGILSAVVIFQKGVAKGVARWFFFVPAVLGALLVAGNLSWIILPSLDVYIWLGALVGLAYAVTGLLYLLNDRKVG